MVGSYDLPGWASEAHEDGRIRMGNYYWINPDLPPMKGQFHITIDRPDGTHRVRARPLLARYPS